MLTPELTPPSLAPDPAASSERPPSRLALSLVVGVPAMLLALVVAMLATGAASPLALGDPGPLVRWGLPLVRGASELAVTVVLGACVLLAVAVRPGTPAWRAGARAAAVAAVVWVLAAVAQLVLGYADVAGVPVGTAGFGSELGFYLTEVESGQLLAWGALLAVVAATVPAIGITSPSTAGAGAVLTAVALVPLALGGHASGGGHRTAVSAWWLHGVGVGVWVGGLVALALVARALGPDLAVVARRYSTLALASFVLVVVTGVANGWVQLAGTPSALLSGYGALLLVKSAATLALGAAGWLHRRRALAGLEDGTASGGSGFARLVAGEVVVMAATIGVAVALARTGPPQAPAEGAVSLAEQMTEEPVPPMPLTAGRFFTETNPDLLWLLVAGVLAWLYLAGVRRLHQRGDAWPVGRTVGWLAGLVVLVWVTSGGPSAYAELLFSAHMVAHMVLAMVVPLLLVVGAPVTLAVRTLPRRRDGSRGPREWLLVLVHSRWARLVSHPLVAAAIFAVSLLVFYYSPLFELALDTHLGHELMQVHFLASGYLFASAIIGVDPGTDRPSYPLRLLLLLATMAFHAFFGVTLMSGNSLLAASWFSSLGLGVDALADQQTGGGIAWGIGEFPTLVLAAVLAVQWSRSDTREAKRSDRAADRDDAALDAYNAMLAQMAGGERSAAGSSTGSSAVSGERGRQEG